MRERSVYLLLAGGLVVATLAYFARPLFMTDGAADRRQIDLEAGRQIDSTPTATVPPEFTIKAPDGGAPEPKGNWPAFKGQKDGLYAEPAGGGQSTRP